MNKEELSTIIEKHGERLKGYKDGEIADLRDADLQGANLDFSCWPMWCGGSKFKANSALVRQMLAQLCTIDIFTSCSAPSFSLHQRRLFQPVRFLPAPR